MSGINIRLVICGNYYITATPEKMLLILTKMKIMVEKMKFNVDFIIK